MKPFFTVVKRFFMPPATAPVLVRVLPFASIAFVMLLLFVFATVAWEETNAVSFCGLTCHTMPPEYITHQASAHANVSCEDCHMGRDKLGVMLPRKITYSWQTGSAMVSGSYEYPIVAKNMRPALDACENCHKPETFTSDKLVELKHYAEDEANTPTSTYLVIKTGGGTRRQGLGFGIHWHVENPVYFYSTDRERQQIPYIVVTNSDGTKTEYVDVESGVDPASIKPDQLQPMDCITCHNRTAHGIEDPASAVDQLLARGLVSTDIPNIKKVAVEKLGAAYASEQEALDAMTALPAFYQSSYPDFYSSNAALVDAAVQALQAHITISYFPDQKVDSRTHPNNAGHLTSPGCFRCHDGKHLTAAGESVRLECNLCHSVPVVATSNQVNAALELNRGFEPESHKHANWISLHRTVFDESCQGCHSVDDMGGTSNQSFCSNSACHGAKMTFAGFDAPKLREVLAEQAKKMVPTPVPSPTPEATATPVSIEGSESTPESTPESGPTPTSAVQVSDATYAKISVIFNDKCGACHGSNGMKDLNLTSYTGIMDGSLDGPILKPRDPANSLLVKVQSADLPHFGQLNPDELALVKAWIQAGALEK